MNISELNQQFGQGTALRFTADASGLVLAEIENPLASARLCLQGAQLLSWRPRTSSIPVVWLSDAVRLTPGKSGHSGVPVCWPWFGNHATESSWPAHGFARTADWEVVSSRQDADGCTHLCLRLTTANRPEWPYSANLELTISIGERLQLALTTTNTGAVDFVITEAFHTYFQVGEVSQARVTGLSGVTYADKVQDYARSTASEDIHFDGEVDRVYLDTEAACVIEDPVLRRRIHIQKSGSRSTVVWTPWQEKGDKMGDLGTDGWSHFLCVESANAMDNQVRVPAGQAHTLSVTYSAEPL